MCNDDYAFSGEDEELNSFHDENEENEKIDYSDKSQDNFTEEDYKNVENCADWAHTGLTYQEKLQAAHNFGPNWANILAGLGDQ
jgi:hypothetical protein